MLYLKSLSLEDENEIYEMLQEIALDDNGFLNPVNGMTYDEFQIWLSREYDNDHGINIEPWRVLQSSYWLLCDDKPVGYGRLRHSLTHALLDGSGHIGYAIAQSQRGRGYGNELLRLLLLEADKLGISEVQISANSNNIPSNTIILNNGGMLIREKNSLKTYIVNRKMGTE